MKTVILALLVLVVISHGEALRCKCGGRHSCSGREETCSGSGMVCATVYVYVGNPGISKGCMRRSACALENRPGISASYCCSKDLCN